MKIKTYDYGDGGMIEVSSDGVYVKQDDLQKAVRLAFEQGALLAQYSHNNWCLSKDFERAYKRFIDELL